MDENFIYIGHYYHQFMLGNLTMTELGNICTKSYGSYNVLVSIIEMLHVLLLNNFP